MSKVHQYTICDRSESKVSVLKILVTIICLTTFPDSALPIDPPGNGKLPVNFWNRARLLDGIPNSGSKNLRATIKITSNETVLQSDFDDAPSIVGWQVTTTNGNDTWVQGNLANKEFSSIDSTSIASVVCTGVDEDQDELLWSPIFSLDDRTHILEFYAGYDSRLLDKAKLKLSIADETSIMSELLWEAGDDGAGWQWRKISVNLDTYKNTQKLRMIWQYIGNGGSSVGIDNLQVRSEVITDVNDDVETEITPLSFSLKDNYPNPFNPSTIIEYVLAQPSDVTITIYTITGQVVRTYNEGTRPQGSFKMTWNGTNDEGARVATGVYIARMVAKTSTGQTISRSKKMTLIK